MTPRIVAFIPIRMNSERIPNKNTRLLAGKPLCHWIMETLLKCDCINDIYAYYQEDEITKFISKGIIPLKRPSGLELIHDVQKAFCTQVIADVYIQAHATAPFLKSATVEEALGKILRGQHDSAFTVRKEQTYAWFEERPLNHNLLMEKTQDLTPVYLETCGFFIWTKVTWARWKSRIGQNPYMARVSKIEGIDIDTFEDFTLAEMLTT